MFRPCLDCGGLIRTGSRCRPCQQAASRRHDLARPAFHRSVYRSAEYRRLRAIVMSRASACFHCGATGVQLTCDHVASITSRPDLALAMGNLVPSCRSCQELRKERTRG